ncbi:hypothetical protein PMZ80_000464 [Knufia obscura]|uniref:FAD dependent oxidoreductase domain-containing protein n=1 Tax=Knufia obscura TaxID=1635080 RepID=A0ABR0S0B9_9EURO|nr:hypothetical protein PMZ80_000464 [Knufia obscura]
MAAEASPWDLVVIGSGVIGLTTACLLQQRLPEHTNITIVASEFPNPSPMTQDSSNIPLAPAASSGYASMWAGAHYRPIPYLSPSNSQYGSLSGTQQRFQSQLACEHHLAIRTAKMMKQLAREHPETGIEIMPGVEYLENPPAENLALETGDVYASLDDGFRVITATEIEALNKRAEHDIGRQIKWACKYETYVVNVHVYCAWLLQRFLSQGGRVVQRRLHNVGEALQVIPEAARPIVVNCSGVGLTPDPKMKIIRGQTILVRNQYHSTTTRQCADGTWSFLIPRPLGGGTVIGGTKQVGDLETSARPEERKRLLDSAVRCFPDFVSDVKDFEVVSDNVGRRPWREGGMRIEVDELVQGGARIPIVHGYGAGGRGYELSWGAAEEICKLVEKSGKPHARL